jgi:hypothetical protein
MYSRRRGKYCEGGYWAAFSAVERNAKTFSRGFNTWPIEPFEIVPQWDKESRVPLLMSALAHEILFGFFAAHIMKFFTMSSAKHHI